MRITAGIALWVWRIVVVALLAWIGYLLHRLPLHFPDGLPYDVEQKIGQIASDNEKNKLMLAEIERNTRHPGKHLGLGP